MRWTLVVILASIGYSQSLLEHAGAAAGGSVGGVAGKKVSDGLTAIFGKVDQQTKKAAKTGVTPSASAPVNPNEPVMEIGPGVPKQRASVPPPPPPVHHQAMVRKQPQVPLPVRAVALPAPRAEVEKTPPVSTSALREVTTGMKRNDVLKLGMPSARVTMYDDGHLFEIYRYVDGELSLGAVRLTDGAVSSVQVR